MWLDMVCTWLKEGAEIEGKNTFLVYPSKS